MAHFFISFSPYLSVAPYLLYAPAIPVCSILQPCVSARQESECRSLLDPRNTWTCTNDAWAYWIQIDRRKSTIHERSVRTERQEGLLTDRLTVDFFSLRKGWHLFFFLFFFQTSAAALYLLNLTSVKQSRIVGTTIFLQRSYTTPMALESSRLAELKYAISAAWNVKKITAFDRAHLNETFPRSKSVLP